MKKINYIKDDYSITIVIDNIVLGPALGGCRIWKYDSDVDAEIDCERLAKGMTYKNSLCGLNYGGGKAVINLKNKRERLNALSDLAYMINMFNGEYITAEDVGVTKDDLEYLRNNTNNIASRSKYDASNMTAYGVYMSMKASCYFKYGNKSLYDKVIAIHGVGKVGKNLALYCAKEGAIVYVADLDFSKAKEIANSHGNIVAHTNSDFHKIKCNIYAPCALGGTINSTTIPDLNCDIICGCANNQLGNAMDPYNLQQSGILYAPDYLVNAGGVLTILVERHEKYKSIEDLKIRIEKLYDTTLECFKKAERKHVTTTYMAHLLAKKRINETSNK